jgi:hypothetical protein
MTFSQDILDFTGDLFDALGVTQLSNTDNLLILGLESTAEHNLDEFESIVGRFSLAGYEKYVKPGLESILQYIDNKGFRAKPVGRLGYPLNDQIYLKGEPLRAGMGKRGKNTVILHPRFGTILRLVALVIDAPQYSSVEPILVEEENPICWGVLFV